MIIKEYLETIQKGGGDAGVSYLIAAEAAGVSKATISQMVKRGELQAVKVESDHRSWRHITARSLLKKLNTPPLDSKKIKARLEALLWEAAYVARNRKWPRKLEYGALMDQVGMRWSNPNHRRQIGELLGAISTATQEKYGFLLTALAVRKATRRPNDQFFELARGLDAEMIDDDTDRFYREQLRKIAAYAKTYRKPKK